MRGVSELVNSLRAGLGVSHVDLTLLSDSSVRWDPDSLRKRKRRLGGQEFGRSVGEGVQRGNQMVEGRLQKLAQSRTGCMKGRRTRRSA